MTLKQLVATKALTAEAIAAIEQRVHDRNTRAAKRAAEAADPPAADVIKYMYTDTKCETVPAEFQKVRIIKELPVVKRTDGQITYRDALKEALIEEMKRGSRVIFYGEDVSDYGGAFKLSKGLLEAFGRDRVFNTPISEACICGSAVGAAMIGLRPVVELMYMDFALMSSDQISNPSSSACRASSAASTIRAMHGCSTRPSGWTWPSTRLTSWPTWSRKRCRWGT